MLAVEDQEEQRPRQKLAPLKGLELKDSRVVQNYQSIKWGCGEGYVMKEK